MCTILVWKHISPEANGEGFIRSSVHLMQWMGLMMVCCGMAVKRVEVLELSVRKMKALAVKMETVTVIGKGRQNVTRFVYEVYDINS